MNAWALQLPKFFSISILAEKRIMGMCCVSSWVFNLLQKAGMLYFIGCTHSVLIKKEDGNKVKSPCCIYQYQVYTLANLQAAHIRFLYFVSM